MVLSLLTHKCSKISWYPHAFACGWAITCSKLLFGSFLFSPELLCIADAVRGKVANNKRGGTVFKRCDLWLHFYVHFLHEERKLTQTIFRPLMSWVTEAILRGFTFDFCPPAQHFQVGFRIWNFVYSCRKCLWWKWENNHIFLNIRFSFLKSAHLRWKENICHFWSSFVGKPGTFL